MYLQIYSHDGTFLAYGSADGSVGILSTQRMYKTQYFPNAHSFSVTTIDIHPLNLNFVSGAPDYSCECKEILSLDKAPNLDSVVSLYRVILVLFIIISLFIGVFVLRNDGAKAKHEL